jgi:hypothetical protein
MANGQQPKIGDAVFCDGELLQVTAIRQRYAQETGELVAACSFENAKVRHYALVRELRWDAELGAWHLWGRVLAHDDAVTVRELRDRGLLPSRRTRMPGSAPAGGEHLDLHLALFHGRPRGWLRAELTAYVGGGEFSDEAKKRFAEFEARWHGPHADGYADPDAPPSTSEISEPAP